LTGSQNLIGCAQNPLCGPFRNRVAVTVPVLDVSAALLGARQAEGLATEQRD
jgi:hypothetical protein